MRLGRFQQKQIENVLRRYIGESSTLELTTTSTEESALVFTPTIADDLLHSRVRHLQDLSISRYSAHEGQSTLLHRLRLVRFLEVGIGD